MENKVTELTKEELDEVIRYVFVSKTLSAIIAQPHLYNYDELVTIEDGSTTLSDKFSEFLSSILK